MMRVIVPLTLIGLVVVPDWATAFGWRLRCPTPRLATPCPPRQLTVVSPCLPLAFDPWPPAPPVVPSPPAEPQVYAEPQAAPTPAKPEPVKPEAPKATAPKPPSPGIPPDAGAGAGRSDAAPPPETKGDAKPAGFATPTPAIPTLPPTTEPKPLQVTPESPAPAPAPPRDATPPKPPADTPKAASPVIPPLVPPVPGGSDSTIPPLSIPQAPGGANTRVAQASPLSGGPTVDVFPVEGELPSPTARRAVGFFNHTDRDISLMVEGESVTLPPRHSVTASVPAKFAWAMDGGPERKTEVPAAAPGVEVVIRK